jgi:hypothetical protein
MVGGDGLTANVKNEVDAALKSHGLIKVRVFSDDRTEREAMFQAGRFARETSEPDIPHALVQFRVERTIAGSLRASFRQGGFAFRNSGGVYFSPVWQVEEDFGVPEGKDWAYTGLPYWSGCGTALEFRVNRPLVLYWGPDNVLMAIAKFEPGAYEALMARRNQKR